MAFSLPAVGTGSGPVGSPLSPGEEGRRPPPSSVASPSRQKMRSSEGRTKSRYGGGRRRPTAAMSTYRTATEPNHQRRDSVMVPSAEPTAEAAIKERLSSTDAPLLGAVHLTRGESRLPARLKSDVYWISTSRPRKQHSCPSYTLSQRTDVSSPWWLKQTNKQKPPEYDVVFFFTDL